jgi:hypothetical protein
VSCGHVLWTWQRQVGQRGKELSSLNHRCCRYLCPIVLSNPLLEATSFGFLKTVVHWFRPLVVGSRASTAAPLGVLMHHRFATMYHPVTSGQWRSPCLKPTVSEESSKKEVQGSVLYALARRLLKLA